MERTNRYRPTALKSVIDFQGRRLDWVAERSGVHQSLITHLIAGRRTIDQDVAQKIATTLGVPLFFIFELSPDSELLEVSA